MGCMAEVSPSGSQPVMVDWSVGVDDSAPGLGLLGSTEPTWRELADVADVAVFTTHSSHVKGDVQEYAFILYAVILIFGTICQT